MRPSEAEEYIGEAQGEGTPAGAVGIEEVEDALGRDIGGHGDIGGIESGETGADAAGQGDDAADAGGEVVGAFVAENLEGHAGRDFAFEGGVGGVLGPGLGEGGEKAADGGTEADAGDVDIDGLTVDDLQGLRFEIRCTRRIVRTRGHAG